MLLKNAEAKATLQLIEKTEHINARALQDILEYELGIDRSKRQQSWKKFFVTLKKDKSTGDAEYDPALGGLLGRAQLFFERKQFGIRKSNHDHLYDIIPTPRCTKHRMR